MGVKQANWAVNWDGISAKFYNTVRHTWHLGFTSFGGPPVHFKIFHDKFVAKLSWIDEQVYQELFSVCQAFSGPGSTKMLYCINLIHDGFLAAVLGFLIWSLPGALGMFGLAIGVSNIGESLPRPVYALLSGLNAATVGIIALAAVQLAQKAITDKLTRLLVFLGAAAGLLYNALWYFPLLMLIAGIISVIHDFRWLHPPVKAIARIPKNLRTKITGHSHKPAAEVGVELAEQQQRQQQQPGQNTEAESDTKPDSSTSDTRQRHVANGTITAGPGNENGDEADHADDESDVRNVPESHRLTALSWPAGLGLILLFLATFIVVLVLRGVLPSPPLLYRLFANMVFTLPLFPLPPPLPLISLARNRGKADQ